MLRPTVCLVCAAALLCCAGRVLADATVAIDDWNDGSLQDWTRHAGCDWVSVENPSTFLQVTLNPTDTMEEEPGAEWWALVYVPATSLFAGNWQTNFYVEFDFWASNVIPEYVQVMWAGASSNVWRSTVFDSDTDSMSLTNWTTFRTSSFLDFADWDYGGGDQDTFVSDLAAIDWIGIYIWRNTDVGQIYGIDNFKLMVPEPAEWCMLLVSAVTSALSLRRKRRARRA